MEKNEIKKMLYRENPKAKLLHILKGIAYYNAKHNDTNIDFEIPVDELKGADFYLEMDTKFLIRWLV
jgi:hypothetical protein